MYVVILAGGIASGKSTVARRLLELGCVRVDLDELSREATGPHAPALAELQEAFGPDVLDEGGMLRRKVLAERAFASAEGTARLESIVHPHVRRLLRERLDVLGKDPATGIVVVEVPLLDRVVDLIDEVDEVLVVSCPVCLRRVRAMERGMDGCDFDARAAKQPTVEWLCAHADTVLDNAGTSEDLQAAVDAWFSARSTLEGGAGGRLKG